MFGLIGGGYQNNPQYDAYLSMFELNQCDTDIVFLGDSITARGRFEEFFPNEKLLNRGIGSDTSEGVLNRLQEVVEHNPKKIFLMIGINDLGKGMEIEQTIFHVQQIVEYILEFLPECNIFIQSVLPTKTIKMEKIKKLNIQYEKLAEKSENCHYIDIFSFFTTTDGMLKEEYISADGVHLNGNGYQAWIGVIQPYVDVK